MRKILLPFEVQDWPMLAARYPKALERLWVIEDVPEGESPSLLRDHVFDCPGGVRIVVSRDSYQGEICTSTACCV